MKYLIKNAKVIDGVSNQARFCDVGIVNERVYIDGLEQFDFEDASIINASKLTLSPGFIDVHRHADFIPFDKERKGIEAEQGITTVINGNCGFSPFPKNEDSEQFNKQILGEYPDCDFVTAKEFFEKTEKVGMMTNMGYLVGNGSVRVFSNGFSNIISRKNFEVALGEIKKAIDEGALGISLGLMYSPENSYKKKQLLEIFQLSSKKDALIVCHIRGEGNSILQSIKELLKLQRKAKNRLHISHLKFAGKENWNSKIYKVLRIIKKQKSKGYEITFDLYPYTAGSTFLTSLLPPYALKEGIKALLEKAGDKTFIKKVEKDFAKTWRTKDNLIKSTTFEAVTILSSTMKECVGKNVREIAKSQNKSEVEVVFDLIKADEGLTMQVFFSMSDKDVQKLLEIEDSIIISDSLYVTKDNYHPRVFGSFAKSYRMLKNSGKLSQCQIIKKMTSIPAEVFRIKKRGKIQDGYYADLVLFDENNYRDTATYSNSKEKVEGIKMVFVNGEIVYEEGKIINSKSGRLIKNHQE